MTVMHLCRVTVQSERDGQAVAVDVSLPGRSVLTELVPFIVSTVMDVPWETAGTAVGRWTLSRLGDDLLDESVSLYDNGVRDGDVLLLEFATPTRRSIHLSASQTVVAASPSSRGDAGTARPVGALACVWAMGAAAAALVCGPGAQGSRAFVAALVAAVAAGLSVTTARLDPSAPTSTIMGVAGSVFTAVTGFLVVPGGPAAPNFFLASAACAAIATVLLFATRRSAWFVAIAAFSSTAAIAAAGAALWPVPVTAVGAALAVSALAMLGLAARLAMLLTGLSADEVSTGRAHRGHAMLTGLLAGFSASAALGTVLVCVGAARYRAPSGVLLLVAVSLVLLLRTRQHRSASRVDTIFAAGIVCLSAAFGSALLTLPTAFPWICLLSVAIGSAAVCLQSTGRVERMSPVVRRGIDVLEYAALASVVPLACWVSGVFGTVRDLNLT
jgi:type VII secretion integral membrane protein EccD